MNDRITEIMKSPKLINLELIDKTKTPPLTDGEIERGHFMDYVPGKCNTNKALQNRDKAIRRGYEVFDMMHRCDGTLIKSVLRL